MDTSARLAAARLSFGWSLDTVRQMTGIGLSTLSELENGKREPSISQLSTLAKAYNRSLSSFFDSGAEAAVLWRERPSETVASQHEAMFRRLCDQYRHLESWCGDIIKPAVPTCRIDAQSFSGRDAEDLARDVRHELNLGEYPAFGLLSTLENVCGIKIFHVEIAPTGTAACVRGSDDELAIFLNVANIYYRRNFDLAHELFHLITWDSFRLGAGATTVASEVEEKLANRFATNLLIPTDTLRRAVERKLDGDRRLSSAAVPSIAQQFGVSIDAAMWRVHNVYKFGQGAVKQTETMIAEAKRVVDYRTPAPEMPPKYPERYMTLAKQALLTDQIAIGKFCEYTDWGRRDAMALKADGEPTEVRVSDDFDNDEFYFE